MLKHIKLASWQKKNKGKYHIEKWPICAIYGDKVSKEQADEIIRRTDAFFGGYDGNDHAWNNKAAAIVGRPDWSDFRPKDNEEATNTWDEWYGKYVVARDAFREKWRYIETYHLSNEWLSTCNAMGALGWCHPDGTIQYSQNIGKYPEIKEVLHDLTLIAEAFPFLHMFCTIVNHNDDYTRSEDGTFAVAEQPEAVITFEVEDGEVGILSEALPTFDVLLAAGYNPEAKSGRLDKKMRKLGKKAGHDKWDYGEGIYSHKHLKKWAKMVKNNNIPVHVKVPKEVKKLDNYCFGWCPTVETTKIMGHCNKSEDNK